MVDRCGDVFFDDENDGNDYDECDEIVLVVKEVIEIDEQLCGCGEGFVEVGEYFCEDWDDEDEQYVNKYDSEIDDCDWVGYGGFYFFVQFYVRFEVCGDFVENFGESV